MKMYVRTGCPRIFPDLTDCRPGRVIKPSVYHHQYSVVLLTVPAPVLHLTESSAHAGSAGPLEYGMPFVDPAVPDLNLSTRGGTCARRDGRSLTEHDAFLNVYTPRKVCQPK